MILVIPMVFMLSAVRSLCPSFAKDLSLKDAEVAKNACKSNWIGVRWRDPFAISLAAPVSWLFIRRRC
jgi:hypothetical protein